MALLVSLGLPKVRVRLGDPMYTLIHLETGIQEEIVSQGTGAKMYPHIMMGTSSNC